MNRAALIGWWMTSLAGCSMATEDETAPAGTSPTTEARTLGILGNTFELAPRSVAPGTLLDAVEVCTNGGVSCTMTDKGVFFLEGVQPHSRFEVTFRKAGYVPTFVNVDVGVYYGFA